MARAKTQLKKTSGWWTTLKREGLPFSWAIFKFDWRCHWLIFVIITTVLIYYLYEMALMYNPTSMETMQAMFDLFPPELLAAFGMDQLGGNLVEYLGNMYYGMIIFIMTMIYYLIVANGLVAKHVDTGAMAYFLQTPVSRVKLIVTQGVFLLSSLAAMFGLVYAAGVAICEQILPGQLAVAALAKVHFSALALTMMVAMICFFYSCYFDESKKSLAAGAAFAVGFMLCDMIGGVSDEAQFFQDISLFSRLQASDIAANGNPVWLNLVLLMVTGLLFYLSVRVFKKRRLSV